MLDGAGDQRLAGQGAGITGKPLQVLLDHRPGDAGEAGDLGMVGGEPAGEAAQRFACQPHCLRPVERGVQPQPQVAFGCLADRRSAGLGYQVIRPAGALTGPGQRRLADLPDVEQQHVDGVQPGQLRAGIPQPGAGGHPARSTAEQQLAQLGEIIALAERADRCPQLEQIFAGDGVQVRVAAVHQQPAEPPRQVLAGAFAGVAELSHPAGMPLQQGQVDTEPPPARGGMKRPGELAAQQELIIEADTTGQRQVDQVPGGLMAWPAAGGAQAGAGKAEPHRQRRGEPVLQVRPAFSEPPVDAHPRRPRVAGGDMGADPAAVVVFARVRPRQRRPSCRGRRSLRGHGPARSAAAYSARTCSSLTRV